MKYCNRTLVYSPVYYGLVISQEQFEKELKRLKVEKSSWGSFVNNGFGATTHFLEDETDTTCIVGISVDGQPIEQIYALLAHEATHIWQEIKRIMREKDPSPEFEAYSIQNISQNLMEAYKELKEKQNV